MSLASLFFVEKSIKRMWKSLPRLKSDSPRYKLIFTSVQNLGLLGEKYKLK